MRTVKLPPAQPFNSPATGKILHLTDGKGWTLDVPLTDEQWASFKRAARRERMKVADWIMRAIRVACEPTPRAPY